jgi:putative flavoprotein involved in K+ transport
MSQNPLHDVIVVGGGPGGLSVAHELTRRGLTPLVLERTPQVGDVWRNHYDGLCLNTPGALSGLPGNPFPREAGRFPSRDDVVRLLEGMPARGGFQVRTGREVTRVSRDASGDAWTVEEADGTQHRGRAVVMATGGSRVPVMPKIEGLDSFRGEFLHASQFRRAADYAGKTVLVIGSGNTAAEIASRLSAYATQVYSAVRTPPVILPKVAYGVPLAVVGIAGRLLPQGFIDALLARVQRWVIGDLSAHGLPYPRERLSRKFSKTNVVPTLYVQFAHDVRAGKVNITGPIRRIEDGRVIVQGAVNGAPAQPDRVIEADVIIAGTGYRPGLESLIRLPDLFTPLGKPVVNGAKEHPAAPGLFFMGHTNPLSGQLRALRIEAEQIGGVLAGRLRG